MLNAKALDEIVSRLTEAAANSPLRDFEKNARALLEQGFARLNLVTREEFEIQTQLLQRSQQKLADLEMRVSELESRK